MRPPVRPDVDDVHDHRSRILRPGVETYEQVVASNGASSLDGESPDTWRSLDLGETPPVDQGQRLDRLGQIVSPKDLGPVDWQLFVDARRCVIRDPDRSAHVLAARASSSDLAIASGNRSTARASDASADDERGRAAIASLARAAARSGSTPGAVSVGSIYSTLSRSSDNTRHEACTPARAVRLVSPGRWLGAPLFVGSVSSNVVDVEVPGRRCQIRCGLPTRGDQSRVGTGPDQCRDVSSVAMNSSTV